MRCDIPRIMIGALKGGAGKTLVTLGLVAALRRRGFKVSVFKKGPDYIDANWLGLAAGSPCYNLDSYMMEGAVIVDSFARRSAGFDIAVIEGARGLFDGVDSTGAYSTAELAKKLKSPIALIVEGSKMSGTAAALTKGCQIMDPELMLEAVILNRVAGPRHENILKSAIFSACAIPTVGNIAKQTLKNFPQRHLGLLPIEEHPAAFDLISQVETVISESVDIDAILKVAAKALPLTVEALPHHGQQSSSCETGVRIGVLRDSAFQFYYNDNLDALRAAGADLIELSALHDHALPDLDGLYIGGGFPETNAEALSANIIFRESLFTMSKKGLPIYAECGGLMYLSRRLIIDGREFPMVGIFPLTTILKRKPQGLGYTEVLVNAENPFYPVGTTIRGHEFHYSTVELEVQNQPLYAFRVIRGHGMDGTHDGICVNNAMGSYLHVHALGTPIWATALVKKAADFKMGRSKS